MTSTSLPALGSYLEAHNAVVGAYVPSLDRTGVDALLLPCNSDKSIIILDGQEYGEYAQNIDGAESDTDGQANTDAMAAAGSPLAIAIKALDAFLPAKRDLVAIWASCKELFPSARFWSSTQFGSNDAWSQDFGNGDVYIWSKNYKIKAFPVRRVSASTL